MYLFLHDDNDNESSRKILIVTRQTGIVTGSGRGIGQAIALICHKHGAQVAITSRTRSELQETLELANDKSNNNNNNSSMRLFVTDVTNPSQVKAMVQEIVREWGGLDVLVNNAGGAQRPKGPVDSLNSDDLQSLLLLNVVGPQIVTSAVLEDAMNTDDDTNDDVNAKKIINISSKAGKVGLENYSFYVASKFALEGLTSCWAKELSNRNILVHSISPGMVNTRSFPKPSDKPGVRRTDAIEDSLLLALTATKDFTGHYVHADELDMVRAKGLSDSNAWKAIDEPTFSV